MNVIAFRKRQTGNWSETELQTLRETLEIGRRGQGWDAGLTESGDAQFYLLGPDQACTLCVSRIGGLYVLEDDAGTLLFEHRSLPLVAIHARGALRKTRWPLVARIVMVWCTIRHMINDRVEPLLLEGEELLVHLAPQLAAYV
ncbi:MAG: hypothetical protein CFE29_13535 [Bradyrhizobiaceae bacterium PARB1]|jgi:hypothetical protein|nr:MAG: hypothetical protein CFE29_13535 [Bradyrhizobiaceae bacterium PARB1]